jgi:DNA-binding transcriptional LysR family regulator
VASPACLKRKGEPTTPKSLAKHDALTYAAGGLADSWPLSDDEREARVRVNATFRSNAPHAIRKLALQGAGTALLPD